MIHHETYSARNASEWNGVGHFNVIETRGEFQVLDGDSGMVLYTCETLEEACEAAQDEADAYERRTFFSVDADKGEIEQAIRQADKSRRAYEAAQVGAEEALTTYFERHFRHLAQRFPKRRFHAFSGNGCFCIQVYPGPGPLHSHHPRKPYTWAWGGMFGGEKYWSFLWQPWENMLTDFAKRLELDYVNFTRDIDIKGRDYQEEA